MDPPQTDSFRLESEVPNGGSNEIDNGNENKDDDDDDDGDTVTWMRENPLLVERHLASIPYPSTAAGSDADCNLLDLLKTPGSDTTQAETAAHILNELSGKARDISGDALFCVAVRPAP